ncbi:MAG: hypothetical protein QOG33_1528 [Gaiellales bacterium]|nr:hypothetical protein [Gaiellales bacterium]
MIAEVVALLAANGCFLVAGIGLGRALGVWTSRAELAGAVGLLYMLGVAVCGSLAALALIAGLSLELWQVLAGCGLLALTGLARSGGSMLRPALPAPRPAALMTRAIQALLTVYLAVLFVHDALRPLVDWDAWTMWTMKARAIILLHGLDPALFAAPAYRALHLDYPLLYPALEAIDFRFMGSLNTQVIHLQAWLLMVGFLVALAELLRDRVPAVLLWPALLLIGLAPSLTIQIDSASADAPLAIMFALAALAGWRYVDGGEWRWAVLMLAFAAAAAAIKQEGTVFVPLLLLTVLAFSWSARRPMRPVVLAAVAVFASMLPWLLWAKLHHAIHSNGGLPIAQAIHPGYLFGRVDRLPVAVAGMVREALRPGAWTAMLPLAAALCAAALLARRGRRLAVFTLTVVSLTTAAVLSAYWIGKPEVHWYVDASARRTVTTAVLTAGAFVPLLISELASARRPVPVPSAAEPDAVGSGSVSA